MLAAAIIAKGSVENRAFADFLFMSSNALLHEMAHVFITYLGRGKEGTPLSSTDATDATDATDETDDTDANDASYETGAEAGFDLEFGMFRGKIGYYSDPDNATPVDGVCSNMVALVHCQSFGG